MPAGKKPAVVDRTMAEPFAWPEGRRCAVSLTYDDAVPVHYEYVGPALLARQFRGTFYLLISGDPMLNFQRWRELGEQGHELGNHTLFHPCHRNPPERYPWLDEGFDLSTYTPYRFQLELRVANLFLHLLDGKRERTYGNTCSETSIGTGANRVSMDGLLRCDFVAARGAVTNRMVTVSRELNLFNPGHCVADFRGLEDLCSEISTARERGAWIIYMIHGVGPETKELYIERDVHEQLLDWLAAQNDVWVSPLIDVAKWIRLWQQNGS